MERRGEREEKEMEKVRRWFRRMDVTHEELCPSPTLKDLCVDSLRREGKVDITEFSWR